MQEEINLKDLLLVVLRKWRGIVVFALIAAFLTGIGGVIVRYVKMHDEEQIARWEAEYNASYGAYWAAINDFDRQIQENQRLSNALQTKIDALDRIEDNLQDDIADTKSAIAYNKSKIQDYEASILSLEQRKEELEFFLADQVERNEKSLYMKLDPYHVQASVIYLRVDTGYQVIPDSTYQNPDRTGEVLETYRMLVTNTEFFTQMIQDLSLDTEVRYLNELITVYTYGNNSLCISVKGLTEDWTEKASQYIRDKMLSQHDLVSDTVTEHTISEYSHQTYSYIDLGVYSEQQSRISAVTNYQTNIRDVDASILNTNTEIRNLNADIRNQNNTIEDLQDEIESLPDMAEQYQSEIAAYEDAKYELLSEQLKLKKEPEPQYEGYTALSLLTGFVKYCIFGGLGGGIASVIFVIAISILSGRVESADTISRLLHADFYGLWPIHSGKRFEKIDNWANLTEGIVSQKQDDEALKALVLSNVETAVSAQPGKLLVCGSASLADIKLVAEALIKHLPKAEILFSGDIGADPDTIRNLAACSSVLLVERRSVSDAGSILTMAQRAKAMEKPILGFVVL